jgi:hypothetical protein
VLHDTDLFRNSSLREKVIEHLFVGELLRLLWRRGNRDFEVLRAEVDRSGYDIAVECCGVFRHIQLKSSHRGAVTQSVNVHVNLSAKPSGCVIWVMFDAQTLTLGPFLWLGGAPGEQLPDLENVWLATLRVMLPGERPSVRISALCAGPGLVYSRIWTPSFQCSSEQGVEVEGWHSTTARARHAGVHWSGICLRSTRRLGSCRPARGWKLDRRGRPAFARLPLPLPTTSEPSPTHSGDQGGLFLALLITRACGMLRFGKTAGPRRFTIQTAPNF